MARKADPIDANREPLKLVADPKDHLPRRRIRLRRFTTELIGEARYDRWSVGNVRNRKRCIPVGIGQDVVEI